MILEHISLLEIDLYGNHFSDNNPWLCVHYLHYSLRAILKIIFENKKTKTNENLFKHDLNNILNTFECFWIPCIWNNTFEDLNTVYH